MTSGCRLQEGSQFEVTSRRCCEMCDCKVTKEPSKSRSRVWKTVMWFTRKGKSGKLDCCQCGELDTGEFQHDLDNTSEVEPNAHSSSWSFTRTASRKFRISSKKGRCKSDSSKKSKSDSSFSGHVKHLPSGSKPIIKTYGGVSSGVGSPTATGSFCDFGSSSRVSSGATRKTKQASVLTEIARELNPPVNQPLKEVNRQRPANLAKSFSSNSVGCTSDRPNLLSPQGVRRWKSFPGPFSNTCAYKRRNTNQQSEDPGYFSPPSKQKCRSHRRTATFGGTSAAEFMSPRIKKSQSDNIANFAKLEKASSSMGEIRDQDGSIIGIVHFYKSPKNNCMRRLNSFKDEMKTKEVSISAEICGSAKLLKNQRTSSSKIDSTIPFLKSVSPLQDSNDHSVSRVINSSFAEKCLENDLNLSPISKSPISPTLLSRTVDEGEHLFSQNSQSTDVVRVTDEDLLESHIFETDLNPSSPIPKNSVFPNSSCGVEEVFSSGQPSSILTNPRNPYVDGMVDSGFSDSYLDMDLSLSPASEHSISPTSASRSMGKLEMECCQTLALPNSDIDGVNDNSSSIETDLKLSPISRTPSDSPSKTVEQLESGSTFESSLTKRSECLSSVSTLQCDPLMDSADTDYIMSDNTVTTLKDITETVAERNAPGKNQFITDQCKNKTINSGADINPAALDEVTDEYRIPDDKNSDQITSKSHMDSSNGCQEISSEQHQLLDHDKCSQLDICIDRCISNSFDYIPSNSRFETAQSSSNTNNPDHIATKCANNIISRPCKVGEFGASTSNTNIENDTLFSADVPGSSVECQGLCGSQNCSIQEPSDDEVISDSLEMGFSDIQQEQHFGEFGSTSSEESCGSNRALHGDQVTSTCKHNFGDHYNCKQLETVWEQATPNGKVVSKSVPGDTKPADGEKASKRIAQVLASSSSSDYSSCSDEDLSNSSKNRLSMWKTVEAGLKEENLSLPVPGETFKMHTELILNWFEEFNDEQKNIVMKKLLNRCQLPQMHLLSVAMEPNLHKACPPNCQDMLVWLPYPVTLKILMYLDPVSLCQCNQVNKTWNELANNPVLWQHLTRNQNYQVSEASSRKQYLKYTLPNGHIHWKKVLAERFLLQRNWLNGKYTLRPYKGHEQGIACVQFDDTRIVSGSSDKTIKLWDINDIDSKLILTLRGHSGTVRCLHLSGNRLVSGSTDRTIKVWDLSFASYWAGASCKVTMVGHFHTVRCLQADDQKLVSGSYDKTVKVWDLKTGECQLTLRGHTAAVLCVQFDDQKIVSGSYDKKIKVWDLTEGTCLMTLDGHQDAVTCLNLTHDGMKIITGSLDYSLKFWDLFTGKCYGTLDWITSEGHTAVVRCLQVDSWRIISGGDDKTLKVWDLATGQRLLTLRYHSDGVTCMQFNDFAIVSGSYDRTVKLWDFAPKHPFLETV